MVRALYRGMLRFRSLGAVLAAIGLSAVAAAATVTVHPAGGGDYADLQAALDAVSSGDTVVVAEGTYVILEPLDINRLHDPADRESPPVKNIRILAPAGSGATVVRMAEFPHDPDRSSVMIFDNGEDGRTVVEGLTFAGGRRLGGVVRGGGGLLVRGGASPTFIGCRMTGSRAVFGGGLFSQDASPRFERCRFDGNSATEGGGIYVIGGEPVFVECAIEGNEAEPDGGGAFLVEGRARLEACRIARNLGGGVVCGEGGDATLMRCTIDENWGSGLDVRLAAPLVHGCVIAANRSVGLGGGVLLENADALLVGCTIIGNMADRGGGICITDAAWITEGGPVIVNSVIAGNRAAAGGGMYSSESSPTIIHTTVTGNRADTGGGIDGQGESPSVANSIVWGNAPESVFGSVSACLLDRDPLFATAPAFDFDRFRRVTVGGTEYDVPDFVVVEPDFRLQEGSPAIDGGDAAMTAPVDIEYGARPCGGGIDIGAYEAGGCPIERFRRGDANADGGLNISDPITALRFLFGGGEIPCPDAADGNDDGMVNVADAIVLLSHLFAGGADVPPALRLALGACALDGTADGLPPCRYEGCPFDVATDYRSFYAYGRGQTVIFCLDRSSSMGQPGPDGVPKFEALKRAVFSALERLSPRAAASVVFYSQTFPLLVYGDPPERLTPEYEEWLMAQVAATPIAPGSCMIAGAEKALELVAKSNAGRGMIILVSDGRPFCPTDTSDPSEVAERIEAANMEGVPIHTFYTGPRSGEDWTIGKPLLERIARESGGSFQVGLDMSWLFP
jgi:hypothetical protein